MKTNSLKRVEFDYDKDEGLTVCTINMGNDGRFYGAATCHPDDKDMCSELTGQTIAHMRANISYLEFLRDMRIKPGLKALKQLYASTNRSKKFQADSYEAKMMRSQIGVYERDLADVKEALKFLRQDLKDYINIKDEKYKVIRKKRKAIELGLDEM